MAKCCSHAFKHCCGLQLVTLVIGAILSSCKQLIVPIAAAHTSAIHNCQITVTETSYIALCNCLQSIEALTCACRAGESSASSTSQTPALAWRCGPLLATSSLPGPLDTMPEAHAIQGMMHARGQLCKDSTPAAGKSKPKPKPKRGRPKAAQPCPDAAARKAGECMT